MDTLIKSNLKRMPECETSYTGSESVGSGLGKRYNERKWSWRMQMELKNGSLVTCSSYQNSFPEQLSLTAGKLGCVCCVIPFCNLQCAVKGFPFLKKTPGYLF